MAIRLGDLLVQEGLITPAQLEEALKYQVIFGGKLGTNLIEMGVLEEEDVARALGKKFGVPVAAVDEIMAAQALDALPREMIEKFGVVPIKLDGRRLTLLMSDPSDLKALDEIAFRTGLIVKPVVAAEVRVVLALEKLYDIARDRRYIHVAKKVVPKRKGATELPPPAVAPQRRSAPVAPPPSAATPPVVSATPPSASSPVSASAAASAAADEALERLAAELSLQKAEPVEELEEIEVLEEICDNETVSLYLAEARDRDDVLDSLASYLSHEFPRCALFLVRGDIAHGWKASIDHKLLAGFDQVQIPLAETSVLKTVAEGRSFFLGPIPRAPFNSMFLQEIGGRVPETALLVPLLMMGRVVGIMYVDGKGEELSERLFELQKLTAKAAMAFEILVLKNKILSM